MDMDILVEVHRIWTQQNFETIQRMNSKDGIALTKEPSSIPWREPNGFHIVFTFMPGGIDAELEGAQINKP